LFSSVPLGGAAPAAPVTVIPVGLLGLAATGQRVCGFLFATSHGRTLSALCETDTEDYCYRETVNIGEMLRRQG
jgi:hypothetical protein